MTEILNNITVLRVLFFVLLAVPIILSCLLLVFRYRLTFRLKVIAIIVSIILIASFGLVAFSLLAKTPKVIFPTEPSFNTTEVNQNKPVIIKFDRPVNQKYLQHEITPPLLGKWQLDSNLFNGESILTFRPDESPNFGTRYTISLIGIKNIFSTKETRYLFSFETEAGPKISSVTPADGSQDVLADQNIILKFDRPISRLAEITFELMPEAAVASKIEADTISLSHDDKLKDGTLYRVKVYLSHATLNYNSGTRRVIDDKEQIYEMSFKTAGLPVSEVVPASTVVAASSSQQSSNANTVPKPNALNVPAYKQSHMYSCMIAAARSALAYRNINVSESNIIAKVGTDSTAWSGTWSEDGAVWGDPDVGIVGDLDGKANNIGWGYGAHWNPIAKAINALGGSAEVRTSMTVQDLAQEIVNGNPVIIWWVNGVWPAYEVNWKTPAGKSVRAVNSMHVQVVKGFSGTVQNPTAFTVTDSGYGYPGKTFDAGTFKAKWGWFGNIGIVVK